MDLGDRQKCARRFVLWSVLLCGTLPAFFGIRQSIQFDTAPGEWRPAPRQWPSESRLERPSQQPVLLVFAHPQCTCTRATLNQLETLLAGPDSTDSPIRPKVHILLFRPDSRDVWQSRDLWNQAAAIPGVTMGWDDHGTEARLFHVRTSGLLLLYSQDGTLRFEGGVTGSRGHVGDNLAAKQLALALYSPHSAYRRFLVFGCSFFGSQN
jgi:hypothetical protein